MYCPNGCGPVQNQEGDVWQCEACTAKWFIMQISPVQEKVGGRVGRLTQLWGLLGEIRERLNAKDVFIWVQREYLGINIFYADWRFSQLISQTQGHYIADDEVLIEGLIESAKVHQAKQIAAITAEERPAPN